MLDLSQLSISQVIIGFSALFLLTTLGAIAWARLSVRASRLEHQQQIASIREEYEQLTHNESQVHSKALHELELEKARLQTEMSGLQRELLQARDQVVELGDFKAKYLQMQTRFDEQKVHIEQEKSLMERTREQLFKEFELAANKLFEAKQEKFSTASRQNMETILTPFKEQLKAFNQRVEDVYHKENSQRNQLIGQIAELQKQTQKISSDANNLAAALKGDNKAQGNWGEIVLERLLEQSGLQKGSEYETQRQYTSEGGKRFKPDVIVHLPEGKDIVIDAKVSLLDYERYSQCEDAVERELALKKHIDSLRSHIRGLSLKNYELLEGVRTLDFVFIFIPVEAAYVAAMQQAPGLFKEAYERNIVLVSPSSLMVALRTVETLWRYEKQNKNAERIAESAGKLYDQFVLLITALEEVGQYIGKSSLAYDKTLKRLSTGRGNLVKRVEDLKQLGAKTTRQIPNSVKQEETNAHSLGVEGVLDDANKKVVEE